MIRAKIQSYIKNLAMPAVAQIIHQSSTDNVTKFLAAKVLINQIKTGGALNNIQEAEFKVFSQFGDDGIIQYLVNNTKIRRDEKRFVELGVENYLESNTRFLLINNNWSGMVVDSNKDYIEFIKSDPIYWRQDLEAGCSFITKENVNDILKKNSFGEKIGLLHIDIDGNDYWIWKAMTQLRPVIAIFEYNSIFTDEHAIVVSYDPKFYRTDAHFSNLYWGASLAAFYELSSKRGYKFVGTNSAGNNAYFVRADRIGKIKSKTVKEGYTESKYRESRNEKGELTFISGKDRLAKIKEMPVYNIRTKRTVKIKTLFQEELK